jgi:hypothetical protein
MNTRDVPRCLRGNLAESKAYEDGERAGARGLGADVNPWLEKGPEQFGGWTSLRHKLRFHAVTLSGARCGVKAEGNGSTWRPENPFACGRCVRAVEAERRRLEAAWERGRTSAHPK